MTPTSATRRIDRRDGSHTYLLDGQKCDGVTSAVSSGIPKPAMVGWAARTIAEYVAERITLGDDTLIDDLRLVAAENTKTIWQPDPPDAQQIASILKTIHWRDRDQAGNKGKLVHHYAEQIALGLPVDVDPVLVGHVDSYLAFRDDWQPEGELVEIVVGNRTHRYMGTLDLIGTLTDLGVTLVDYKTNRSGPFAETALQLAAYRHAEFYLDPNTGNELPMPQIDSCAVLWLRSDDYDLIPFTAGPEEFETFLHVRDVGHFCTRTAKTVRGDPLPAPRTVS